MVRKVEMSPGHVTEGAAGGGVIFGEAAVLTGIIAESADASPASQLTLVSLTAASIPASSHQPVSDSTTLNAVISNRSPINPFSHQLTAGSIAWHGNFHKLFEYRDGLNYMPGKG
jgi:hypothetical protein